MLYSAPEQYTLTKCTLQRTGNKVRKCAKQCVFLVLDLRTRESIGKQRKIGHKTRFVYFGSPNGVRTHVARMRIWCPEPLDDGTTMFVFYILEFDFAIIFRHTNLFVLQHPTNILKTPVFVRYHPMVSYNQNNAKQPNCVSNHLIRFPGIF